MAFVTYSGWDDRHLGRLGTLRYQNPVYGPQTQVSLLAIKPTFWKAVFGQWYWNKRQVIGMETEGRVMLDSSSLDREGDDQEDIEPLEIVMEQIEETMTMPRLVTLWETGADIFTIDGRTFDKMKWEGVKQFLEDNSELEEPLITAGEPVPLLKSRFTVVYLREVREDNVPVKRVRRRFHSRYETDLLMRLREKFVWRLTPYTDANVACLHHYAVQLMKEDNVRFQDRFKIQQTIVDRYFVPLQSDITANEYRNSRAMFDLRERAQTKYVDFNWQRFIGIGVRPHIGGTAPSTH